MKHLIFTDWSELKKQWSLDAQSRAALAKEQAKQRALLAAEQELFKRSVGCVIPLKAQHHEKMIRSVVSRMIYPEPLQRIKDEAKVMKDALSDDFDAQSLLDTGDQLFYAQSQIGMDVVRKLRRGGWVIEAQIDLHGLRREAAREQLALFLHQAVKRRLRCVRVIHGKGNGSPGRESILKTKTKSWLAQKQEVLAFAQARACDGGQGALVVLLMAKKD